MRHSGNYSFTNLGDGRYEVLLTDPDLTGFTYPTKNRAGQTIPDLSKAPVVSMGVVVEFPLGAIRALGAESNGSWRLDVTNRLIDLEADSITGQANALDDPRNNARTMRATSETTGSFNKWFAAVPGSEGSQVWSATTGSPVLLPGQSSYKSGDAVVSEGQTVISVLIGRNASSPGTPGNTQNAVVCDYWDRRDFTIAPGDYAGTGSANSAQRYGSNGTAVWLSGSMGTDTVLHQVQYGVLNFDIDREVAAGVEPRMNAGCNDSRVAWFDSIEDAGGAENVGAVRVHFSKERGTMQASYSWFSVALRATDAVRAEGQPMPNYSSASQIFTDGSDYATLAQTLGAGRSTVNNSYLAPTHESTLLADRVLAGGFTSSLNKQLKNPANGSWVDTVVPFTGGQTADFRLIPSIFSTAPNASSPNVFIEDCIPWGFAIESSNLDYTLERRPDSTLSCDSGASYVRWDLGSVNVRDGVPSIEYTVRISSVLASGVYTNTARIIAQGDPAAADPDGFARLNDDQQIQIDAARGVFLEKEALTPVTSVNRAGQTNDQLTSWEVRLGNIASDGVRDVDIIDQLPVASGTTGNDFEGTMSFVGVTLTRDGDADLAAPRSKFYYTTQATFSTDPADPANTAADGAPSGIWSETPPADPSTVTGVRVVRPGAFAADDLITFQLDMVGVGNNAGDTYRNNVWSRTQGGGLGGLLPANGRSQVQSSSIGDRVWWDDNRNGIQDSFRGEQEPGVSGVGVHLSGTDDLGNSVALDTVTDADGDYRFDGLRPSGQDGYTLTFDKPVGTDFTAKHAQDSTAANDSDADPATGRSDAVLLRADEQNLTIDAGLVRSGGLQISKVLEGAGVEAFAGGDEIVFEVSCTLEGASVFEHEVTLSVGDSTSLLSDVLGPIPAFADCTVVETGSGGADGLADPVEVLIAVDAPGDVVRASLTNYYSAGTISLTKQIEGDDEAVERKLDTAFEFRVACFVEESSPSGAPVSAMVYDGLVKIKGGQTKMLVDDAGSPRVLPLGARCFANETDNGGAAEVSIDHDSAENSVEVVSGSPEELQALTITGVNTFVCNDEVCPRPEQPVQGGLIPGLPVTGSQLGGIASLAAGLVLAAAFLLLRRNRKQGPA